MLEPAGENEKVLVGEVPKRFDLSNVKPWFDNNFDHDYWKEISYKCLSCGACAFVCPTCHCFDIQDEADLAGGVRLKGWDSCCLPIFTRHGSGYNPRDTRDARYRQRVMHKFTYYVDKFGLTACVGCGPVRAVLGFRRRGMHILHRVVADPHSFLDYPPQTGMDRRLEGTSQLQRWLLCQRGPYPLAHAAEGADDEHALRAHSRPNSLSAT